MATTDRKVKKLMREYAKTNNLTKAALRADMDRKTARKYVKAGELPSQMKKPHDWRTREDPFAEDWAECEDMLADAPELQAIRHSYLSQAQRMREHPPSLSTDISEISSADSGSDSEEEGEFFF